MQDSNVNNNDNVTPYRASGNLNTAIGNPRINVNDPMNMNIQSVSTNPSINMQQNAAINNHQNAISSTESITNNKYLNQSINVEKSSSTERLNGDSPVKRSFVSNSEKTKKKKISINFGPEFKIALLIIVILLVFIFLLPLI